MPTKRRKGVSSSKAKNKSKRKTPTLSKIEEVDEVNLFYGYETEMKRVKSVIDNLFASGQAGSLLVYGDSGTGKTTLVEACLASYPVLAGDPDPTFGHLTVVLIKLDGYLQGKNDLATIRLIGRRLNAFVAGDIPDDSGDPTGQLCKVSDSILKIMEQFKLVTERYPNFRLILILENFEVFCKRQQTLLYNMLDHTQHGRSVLVIGLTTRLDCMELLEKRVRSRLSQRAIHLTTPFKSLDSYRKFCHLQAKMIGKRNAILYGNIQCRVADFERQIEKNFSFNRSFDEINRMIAEFSFPLAPSSGNTGHTEPVESEQKQNVPTSSIFLHQDPKIVDLFNLTKNELILLILATKHLRGQCVASFTCKQLHEWGMRVVSLRNTRFHSVCKSIYKMIELDLLILDNATNTAMRNRSKTQGQVWITPHTTLQLNISEFQLAELIKSLGNKVPSYIKQLLN